MAWLSWAYWFCQEWLSMVTKFYWPEFYNNENDYDDDNDNDDKM